MKFNVGLPNWLTLFRVGAIPVFVLVFFLPFAWSRPLAAGVFILAALTDWLDGYLARRLGQSSQLGAFLDPVADKLMVAAALVLLVMADPHPWIAIPALIILGREIAVSALREWMAGLGARKTVSVALHGKIKTATQMLAIAFMLYQYAVKGVSLYLIGLSLLYLSAVLTVGSMLVYLRSAWPQLRSGNTPGEL